LLLRNAVNSAAVTSELVWILLPFQEPLKLLDSLDHQTSKNGRWHYDCTIYMSKIDVRCAVFAIGACKGRQFYNCVPAVFLVHPALKSFEVSLTNLSFPALLVLNPVKKNRVLVGK
jgi:hypothetical protein